MKERLHYIDVIKGILIIIVILHHVLGLMKEYAFIPKDVNIGKLYVPFFMPAFFVVTGYCSSFGGDTLTFLKKNLLLLLIPSLMFSPINSLISCLLSGNPNFTECLRSVVFRILQGGSWFLVALLIAKITYKLIIDSVTSTIKVGGILLLLLLLASIASSKNIFEPFWIYHGFALIIFLWAGAYLKTKNINFTLKHFISALLIYTIYVLVLAYYDFHLPRATMILSIYPYEIPLFLVGGMSGTILVWFLASKINKNNLLEFFGRNSLLIFLTHWILIKIIIVLSKDLPIVKGMPPAMYFITLFIIVCTICALLVPLFNSRYLKWMIGK